MLKPFKIHKFGYQSRQLNLYSMANSDEGKEFSEQMILIKQKLKANRVDDEKFIKKLTTSVLISRTTLPNNGNFFKIF